MLAPVAAFAAHRPLWPIVATLRADARLVGMQVMLPHPLLISVRQRRRAIVLATAAVWDHGRDMLKPYTRAFGQASCALILLGRPRLDLAEALGRGLSATVSPEPDADELFVAIHNALELLDARQSSERRGKWVDRYRYELGELVEIAQAVTTERDIDRLLSLILEKSRFITGADAGSIYVVEGDDHEIARRRLHFKQSQNDSLHFDASEFTVPISPKSMSGFVALNRTSLNIEDVYVLPADAPYGFDKSFDQSIGYRTRSMLCIPLLSRIGDVLGVIQLINKKRDPKATLLDPQDFDELVVPFDRRSEELLATLAAQAGVALENAILYDENQRMLEGFVRASVEAIEQRDPTTSGHSRRVADLTVELARAVERVDRGTYATLVWSPDDLKELEYASLLHDFGKIGVREQVLVKARKLYPHELDTIRARFDMALRSAEVATLRRKLRLTEQGAAPEELAALDQALDERQHKLTEAFRTIASANEPLVVVGGDFATIEELTRETFVDPNGQEHALLLDGELASLSVPRGSLTPAEIEQIRSHVSHTYEFLSRIPWGRKFRRVAQIAGAHHERLDGTGYPHRLRASEIPVQSKIMSVADIFDALTASDRPYKKAVPVARALDILDLETRHGALDGDLVRIFIEAKAWRVLAGFSEE